MSRRVATWLGGPWDSQTVVLGDDAAVILKIPREARPDQTPEPLDREDDRIEATLEITVRKNRDGRLIIPWHEAKRVR